MRLDKFYSNYLRKDSKFLSSVQQRHLSGINEDEIVLEKAELELTSLKNTPNMNFENEEQGGQPPATVVVQTAISTFQPTEEAKSELTKLNLLQRTEGSKRNEDTGLLIPTQNTIVGIHDLLQSTVTNKNDSLEGNEDRDVKTPKVTTAPTI